MRNLKKQFVEQELKTPFSSSYVNFGRIIKGKKLTDQQLSTAFRKLVEKEDYIGLNYSMLKPHLKCLTHQK